MKICHTRPGDDVNLNNFIEALEKNKDLEGLLTKQKQDVHLNPQMVLDIFSNIPKEVRNEF